MVASLFRCYATRAVDMLRQRHADGAMMISQPTELTAGAIDYAIELSALRRQLVIQPFRDSHYFAIATASQPD
jgi:hypothetical protein